MGLFSSFGHNPSYYVGPNPCQKFLANLGFLKKAKVGFDIAERLKFQIGTFYCILTKSRIFFGSVDI